MKKIRKWDLIERGLFPETLPPAFVSTDIQRALGGKIRTTINKMFENRQSNYIRYNGTKHDGSRRYFGTPNPISYFYVCNFLEKNWIDFERRFETTPFSVSRPIIAGPESDRPIIVPSLSQLTHETSKRIRYAPILLRTDISQFFSSIYTHSIPWSAHGRESAKADRSPKSKKNYFNQLDFHVRNCQGSETKGLIIGPDAFRIVAEYMACQIDMDLKSAAGAMIIGAARHVDDYFIGIMTEPTGLAVLSNFREILERYRLSVNDPKTRIQGSLEPLDDLWAQDLRNFANTIHGSETDDIILLLNKGLALSAQIKSDSPIKIALRFLDQIKQYERDDWSQIEPYLQRMMFHHSHCVDYICLLVAKRSAIGLSIDVQSWSDVSHDLLIKHIALDHHHELSWIIWLLSCCHIMLSNDLVDRLSKVSNAHIKSLLIAAYVDGRISRRPSIIFDDRLGSTDENWLSNVVARSTGFCSASFSGNFEDEFEYIAEKKINFVDFDGHMNSVKREGKRAISRTRYGYDNDDDGDDDDSIMQF